MNATIVLFLIVLLVLCIGGPLAGLAAVKRAHAFRIEDGHLVAGRVVSRRYPLGDIERVVFSAQGSERAGYVGAFVVRPGTPAAAGIHLQRRQHPLPPRAQGGAGGQHRDAAAAADGHGHRQRVSRLTRVASRRARLADPPRVLVGADQSPALESPRLAPHR